MRPLPAAEELRGFAAPLPVPWFARLPPRLAPGSLRLLNSPRFRIELSVPPWNGQTSFKVL